MRPVNRFRKKPRQPVLAPGRAPGPLPTCPACLKRVELCVCAEIETIDNPVFVLILQHPQEQDRDLGTARILAMQLKHSRLAVGLSWRSLDAALAGALGRAADPGRWAVLYLGAAAEAGDKSAPLLLLDSKGAPLAGQAGACAALEGIILLDGNWSQAKALWWRNPWLLRVRRIRLNPDFRSLYGKLRREPRRESLSTLEAGAFALSVLSSNPKILPHLLRPFQALLGKYRVLAQPSLNVTVANPETDD